MKSFSLLKTIRKSFIKRNSINIKMTHERLDEKAKNVGSNAGQVQNYEKIIFGRNKNEDIELNISEDIDRILNDSESTNVKLTKVIESNSDDILDVKEVPYTEYLHEADNLLIELHSAFVELQKSDTKIEIESDKETKYNLNLKIKVPKEGLYVISKELETRLITVTSPISGFFKYKYDPLSRYWKSIKDGHILDELLIREFCKHSKGLLLIQHN